MVQPESSITLNESVRRKVQALQAFARKIAHDTNNFYSVLQGYISLIEMSVTSDRDLQKFLLPMKDAIDSGIALNRALAIYYRAAQVMVVPVDLAQLASEECEKFNETYKFPVKVIVEGQLKPVTVEEPAIRSVVRNLCLLAQVTKTPKARLELSIAELDEDTLKGMVLESRSGSYLCMRLTVTLVDYPQQEETEFLNPFALTLDQKKDPGPAMIFRVMQNHRGNLDITSQDQKLTVSLHFPSPNG